MPIESIPFLFVFQLGATIVISTLSVHVYFSLLKKIDIFKSWVGYMNSLSYPYENLGSNLWYGIKDRRNLSVYL